jgi:hypothetical protein
MSKSAECEIWVAVDEDGSWATGDSAETAEENYTSEIDNGRTHVVKLNLTVHFPPVPEVDVEVPVPGNA